MKTNIFKYIFTIIVIGLIIFAIYTIYGKEEQKNQVVQTEAKEEKVLTDLRMGVTEMDTINPILTKNKTIQDISKLIYEPLLTLTEDYKIENCLANEWSKTSPTTYIVKLKENVKWNDGQPLVAKDIQYTIDILKNNETIYSSNVNNIIQVEIIDDYTIKIELSEETDFFEYNLTFPIISYKYFENEDFINTTKNNAPVGTGEFLIQENNDKQIVLKQNNNWWNKENKQAKIETIIINKYSTILEAYNAFKMHYIDIFHTTNINYEEYAGAVGYSVKDYSGRMLDFIALNCENNVLKNVEVRQAINYAINKQHIVSSIYKDKYNISNFPLGYGNSLYRNDAINNEYNQDVAQSVLINNGWEYKNNNWRKTIDYYQRRINLDLVVQNNNEQRVQVAENIKEQLANVGINVNIVKVSDSSYINYLNNKKYDMILTGVQTSFSPDITSFLGEGNYANYSNEEVLNILKEVRNIQDEKLLKEKYERIYEIYKTELPYVMLYNNKEFVLSHYNLYGSIRSKCI